MSDTPSHLPGHAPQPPIVSSIHQSLISCSEALEADDFKGSDDAIADLIGLLNAVAHDGERDAEAALAEIRRFLSCSDSNQMAVDAVALAVPMAVAKLAGASESCRKLGESVRECIVSTCSPRDLLLVFCEALDSLDQESVAFYVAFLLGGLTKVISAIKRRPVQQLKIVLPAILKALHTITLDSDSEQTDAIAMMFKEASDIAASMQQIFERLDFAELKRVLHAILCLYILQIMALMTRSILAYEISSCIPIMASLSSFFTVCELTYMGLITGSDVEGLEATISSVLEGETDNFLECLSFVHDGAILAVIWGCISGENFACVGEMEIVVTELKNNREKRWQAISTLRYIFSSAEYPWWMKSHAIDLLLTIMDTQNSGESNEFCVDVSSMFIRIFACLQAIEKTIIYAPDSNLRKKSFSALKNVLFDLPSSQQYEIVKALIANSSSPSMIAILVDIVKDIFFKEFRLKVEKDSKVNDTTFFWGSCALDVIEIILKPPKGGPPSLPDQTEPVLSALNLYRFILLIESTGKTDHSNALSKKSLRKAYTEWLLPLRALISGIEAEVKDGSSDVVDPTLCSLNPVQLVLHRCIELVEGFLHS